MPRCDLCTGYNGCSCASEVGKVRKIGIGGKKTGIMGILETFRDFYEDDKTPKEIEKEELLEALGEMNHIPEDKKDEYGEAFIREYRRYYKDKEGERPPKLLRK